MNAPKNDIGQEQLKLLLDITPYPELLRELVEISRKEFGWFTKQFLRGIEYPWLCHMIGNSIVGKKIMDIGAGVSPLPLYFSRMGADVTTIDYSHRVSIEKKLELNEWGFLDYLQIDPNIRSLNMSILDYTPMEGEHYDYMYSISVIEHMQSFVRKGFIEKAKNLLVQNGKLILTVDLEPSSNNLWNRDRGKTVEDPAIHGTIDALEEELRVCNLEVSRLELVRRASRKAGDLALMYAVKL